MYINYCNYITLKAYIAKKIIISEQNGSRNSISTA